jgi:5-methyltetrahydrofolate--homocysteine methyltransferase
VDVLLIETSQDILEVKAAVFGCREAIAAASRPVALQVQVTLDTSGRMLLGTDIAAAMVTLEALRVDVIGLNCSTGPEHMRQPVRWLARTRALPISVIPNAGIPHNEGGNAVYPCSRRRSRTSSRSSSASWGSPWSAGAAAPRPSTSASWWRASAAGRRSPARCRTCRASPPASAPPTWCRSRGPTMIGERVNAQGSRKVKRLLLADDYDGILDVAREQTERGAHVLDVCVALTERPDEAEQMRTLVKLLSQGVEAPLCIDSTEAPVLQAALQQCPGRAGGQLHQPGERPRPDRRGAAAGGGARRGGGGAHHRRRRAGWPRPPTTSWSRAPHPRHRRGRVRAAPRRDLIFDALTFTLATGDEEFRRSAVETLEGIRRIKRELPGVLTTLGVSNVSFGLAPHARAVLNSVFLHHCVEAGLDTAIINPAHVKPYFEMPEEERRLADDLIFDRRSGGGDPLAAFIEFFEGRTGEAESTVDPTAEMDPEAALHWKILHRKKEGVEAQVDRRWSAWAPSPC